MLEPSKEHFLFDTRLNKYEIIVSDMEPPFFAVGEDCHTIRLRSDPRSNLCSCAWVPVLRHLPIGMLTPSRLKIILYGETA